MAHTEEIVELTLIVTTPAQSTAVTIAEVLARTMLGLTADDVVSSLSVDRYQQTCHEVHDGADS